MQLQSQDRGKIKSTNTKSKVNCEVVNDYSFILKINLNYTKWKNVIIIKFRIPVQDLQNNEYNEE